MLRKGRAGTSRVEGGVGRWRAVEAGRGCTRALGRWPRCGHGTGMVRAWCGHGAGMVRAWCGHGAGMVRAWCGWGARLGDARLRLDEELQRTLVQVSLPHAPRRHRLAHQRTRILGLRIASLVAARGRRLGLRARDRSLDA